MNALASVLLPPVPVTTTSVCPAARAGVVTVTDVAELTIKSVAAAPPKLTEVVPSRFVPVIVTATPPAVEPVVGVRDVAEGAVLIAAEVVSSPDPHALVVQSNPLPVTGNA